jgi:hypothetical protein
MNMRNRLRIKSAGTMITVAGVFGLAAAGLTKMGAHSQGLYESIMLYRYVLFGILFAGFALAGLGLWAKDTGDSEDENE